MTDTQERSAPYAIEGPVREQRWGSVGFRLADPLAPSACRQATRQMLHTYRLDWVPDLVDDAMVMVSELVTNACRHAKNSSLPAGSLTIWHPNTRLIIAVHDKDPYQPWREIAKADPRDRYLGESGRGLAMVKALAARHLGEVSVSADGDYREEPLPDEWAAPKGRTRPVSLGKVVTVNMLLPNVAWPHTFKDPWRDRVITGRP
ncbi:ATP-binding protein [Streptomyces sp. NPDC054950]